jgi:glycosyltransferase involved in cell wall biosynthesis
VGHFPSQHSPDEQDRLARVPHGVTVSVVIPALNEAGSLPYVLSRIPEGVHEVVLVDGASTDGTIEIARRLMPDVRVVLQDRPGKGAALRAGFEAATGDIVVHLDADGSTDPSEIPSFVQKLVEGADFAKGTRFGQGGSSDDITPVRRLGNWSFVSLANVLFGSRFSDITYGYNALWRRHHALLAPEIDGWAHEIIANIRAHRRGLHEVEVPSHESPRIAGDPKLRTFSAGWTILRAIVGERFRPLANPVPTVVRPIGPGPLPAEDLSTAFAMPVSDEHFAPARTYDDFPQPIYAEAD